MKIDISGRYWCFAAGRYYPEGGMGDFIASTDDYEKCRGLLTAALSSGDMARFHYEGACQILDTADRSIEWLEFETSNVDGVYTSRILEDEGSMQDQQDG